MKDEQLNQLARATAKLAGQMILTAPPLVRIEAAFMLVRAIFESDVKPEKRLELLDEYIENLRNHIVDQLNEEALHVPAKARNERSHRRPGAHGQKKARRKPA
jgi:hypothetical protein